MTETAPRPRAAVITAMAGALSVGDRRQLTQALHAELNPRPTAGHERTRELSALAAMLDHQAQCDGLTLPVGRGRATWRPARPAESLPSSQAAASPLGHAVVERFPVVMQVEYDRQRPPDAPSGKQLSRRFGSWVQACRAVWGLQPDGRYQGLSKPWTNGTRGSKRPATYTQSEAIAAIRECALTFGRRPTSNLYIEWSARRRAHARACGIPAPRLPAYRHYHRTYGGWEPALSLAAISDTELAQARERRGEPGAEAPDAQTPAGRLRAANVEALANVGVRPGHLSEMLKRGFGHLELCQAARLAQALNGSVAWLAGCDADPGQPANPEIKLDVDAVRGMRRQRAIPDQAILDHLGLTTNDWRRLRDGRDQPRLHELIELAGLLATHPHRLLAPAP